MHTHTLIHKDRHKHTLTQIRTCIHIHTRTRTHARTHIHKHTYLYIHTPLQVQGVARFLAWYVRVTVCMSCVYVSVCVCACACVCACLHVHAFNNFAMTPQGNLRTVDVSEAQAHALSEAI